MLHQLKQLVRRWAGIKFYICEVATATSTVLQLKKIGLYRDVDRLLYITATEGWIKRNRDEKTKTPSTSDKMPRWTLFLQNGLQQLISYQIYPPSHSYYSFFLTIFLLITTSKEKNCCVRLLFVQLQIFIYMGRLLTHFTPYFDNIEFFNNRDTFQ